MAAGAPSAARRGMNYLHARTERSEAYRRAGLEPHKCELCAKTMFNEFGVTYGFLGEVDFTADGTALSTSGRVCTRVTIDQSAVRRARETCACVCVMCMYVWLYGCRLHSQVLPL